ncbi:beta-barrel assembly-enhancing protease [Glaciecola petra]|uniref:Putative beta-barrel assembly-enhancing protease n=1 Tax=Glaciecola petra TaxID=3075602 RepID=A0ABU2ZNU7_9ALTE|nr:M48 family metalloprotease [Aestuariibacter sp. P117]MDT0594298.1 M48 family metalloprotease [Aestuariibacter sp. P117]
MKYSFNLPIIILLTIFYSDNAQAQSNSGPGYFQDSIQDNRNQLPEIGVVASDAITIDKEKIIGDVIMRQMRGQAPLVHDPVLQEYIQGIGNRLVIHADNVKFPFKFFMINNPVINAFAFYGGHIGIHTGLLAQASTESELASVLAHEVAHVTQRHLARRIQNQKRNTPLQIASLIGGLLIGLADPEAGLATIQAGMAGSQQASINFTRNNEQEADNIGINILYRAGFDPQGAPAFFGKLAEQIRGRSIQLAFLQTHPLPQERVAQTVTRARSYGRINLPPSIDFHLAKARIMGRYMSTPKRNIERFKANSRNLSSMTTSTQKTAYIASQYGLAIALFENENYADAQSVLSPLLKEDPENLFFLDLMTDVFIKQGQAREAISLLTPHWRLKPKNYVLTLNLANAYLEAQNYKPAIELLRDLLLVSNQNFVAYQLLHDAYNRNQQQKEAHMAQAEIYALISAYPLAIDELQFAYNQTGNDNLEKQRIKGRIAQLRQAQESLQNLSI